MVMLLKRQVHLLLGAAISLAAALQAQDPTEPDPAQKIILTATGKGVQIYTCQKTATGTQWVFQAPEAMLLDGAGQTIGSHGAGPIWRLNDGSSVKGDVLQKSPSPNSSSIPWLLLKASAPAGTGILATVEFIRRSDTQGGAPPAAGCDDQHLGAISRVPYTARYTFYSAKR